MRVGKDRCDVCGEETEDSYAVVGWIRLNMREISISRGRAENGTAVTTYEADKKLDFCNKTCFNKYFNKLWLKKE
jgi:hypothetical protein